jgi:hypothetical protein
MSTKTQIHTLQTILATKDAIPVLKRLPQDLHPYIFRFLADEVKVHYWMDKYDWNDILHVLGEYYYGLHIVFAYFHYIKDTDITPDIFLRNNNAYLEKDKYRDEQGHIIGVEWNWNDDNCDYDIIFNQIADMIYNLYAQRRDINDLYKLLAHYITLVDDINILDDY